DFVAGRDLIASRTPALGADYLGALTSLGMGICVPTVRTVGMGKGSRCAQHCCNPPTPLHTLLRPCFKAFWLPFGAPGDGPPCIRQRPFFIAGDWHGLPRRVRARHRSAWCMGKCMGLFLRFRCDPSPLRLSTLPTMA